MNKLLCLFALLLLGGCQSITPHSPYGFLLNANEKENFEYEIGADPGELIPKILRAAQVKDVEVLAISAIAMGFHPVQYIVYTENQASITFFYWGRTARKGYVKDYSPKLLQQINQDILNTSNCTQYNPGGSLSLDSHVFQKDGKYWACQDPYAFVSGGKLRSVLGEYLEDKTTWTFNNYGN